MKKKKKLSLQEKIDSGKIAKFTDEVKIEILYRDMCCIICEHEGKISVITDYHHVYYGQQAERKPGRNDADKGVGLCAQCHYNIHHGITGMSQELRQFCINYLINFYNGTNKGS